MRRATRSSASSTPAQIFAAARHPEELRLARRRRPPADPPRGCRLRRRGAGRLGEPLPAGRRGRGPAAQAGTGEVVVARDRRGALRPAGPGRPARAARRRAGERAGRPRQRPQPLRLPARRARRLHLDDAPPLRRAQAAAARAGHGSPAARQDPRQGLRGLRDQGGHARPDRARRWSSPARSTPRSASACWRSPTNARSTAR